MAFPANYRKKKCKVARKKKGGTSHGRYQAELAVQAAAGAEEVAAASDEEVAAAGAVAAADADDGMDVDVDISAGNPNASTANVVKPPAQKKKRKDDEWAESYRAKRALSSRDSKIRKLEVLNKDLKDKTSKAERGRKKAVQEMKSAAKEHHRDKKVSREQSLEREKHFKTELQRSREQSLEREIHFKREFQRLQEAHMQELEDAHALAAAATEKQLVTEAAQYKAEQKLKSQQDKQSDTLAKASNRQKDRIAREKRGHKAAMDHLEQKWKKKVDAVVNELRLKHEKDKHKMSQNIDAKDQEMEDDRRKNKDR
jgi:hypothetical protein